MPNEQRLFSSKVIYGHQDIQTNTLDRLLYMGHLGVRQNERVIEA